MPKKLNQFGFAPALVLVIVLLGLAAGVYLVGQTQVFKPKADITIQKETSLTLATKVGAQPFTENQAFRVKILARSDVDTARKVLAEVKYDPAFLEVVRVLEDDHSSFRDELPTPAACLLVSEPVYSNKDNKCQGAGLNTVTFRCGGDTQDQSKTVDKCASSAQLYRIALNSCETSQACNPTPSPSPSASASASAKPSPSAKPTPNPACSFAPGYPSNYSDEGSKCKKAGLNTVTFRCGGDTQDRKKTVDKCVSNSALYQEALKECRDSSACKVIPSPSASPSMIPPPSLPPVITQNPKNFIANWYKKSVDETAGLILLGAESKEGELKTTEQDPEEPVMATIIFRAIKPGTTSITLTGNSAMYNNLDNAIGGLQLSSLSPVTIIAKPSPSPKASASIKPSPSAKPTPNPACSFAPGYPSNYSDEGSKCKKAGLNTVTFRCGGDTTDRKKTIDKCVSNSNLYQEALKDCKTSPACQSN